MTSCKHWGRWGAQQRLRFWGFKCSSRPSTSLYIHIFLASILTPSLGTAWCIFNQCMSAMTPSCHQNMLLCSCMRNSIRGWHEGSCYSLNHTVGPIPAFYYFLVCICVFVCVCGEGGYMHFCGRHSTSCLLCDWGLTIILYISVPMLIAKDKPIAANKHGVKLPEREKVSSPSFSSSSLSKPWHFPTQNCEVFFKSFHASVDKLDQPTG